MAKKPITNDDFSEEDMNGISFGQYCEENMESNDIRDLYANESPAKIQSTPLQVNSIDDFLFPIKINHRELSFSSIKIGKSMVKCLSIKNASENDIGVKIKVIGNGFTVSPHGELQMSAMKEETFEVKFQPIAVGPGFGKLIFAIIIAYDPLGKNIKQTPKISNLKLIGFLINIKVPENIEKSKIQMGI